MAVQATSWQPASDDSVKKLMAKDATLGKERISGNERRAREHISGSEGSLLRVSVDITNLARLEILWYYTNIILLGYY